MKKFIVTWLDEDGNPILWFYCYFKDNAPYDIVRVGESNFMERKENTPYFDPACTVSIADVDLCSVVPPSDTTVVLAVD